MACMGPSWPALRGGWWPRACPLGGLTERRGWPWAGGGDLNPGRGKPEMGPPRGHGLGRGSTGKMRSRPPPGFAFPWRSFCTFALRSQTSFLGRTSGRFSGASPASTPCGPPPPPPRPHSGSWLIEDDPTCRLSRKSQMRDPRQARFLRQAGQGAKALQPVMAQEQGGGGRRGDHGTPRGQSGG